MSDIFDKCWNYRSNQTSFIKSLFNCRVDIDLNHMAEAGYELFCGISPIDNGGPIMSSDDGTKWLQFSSNDYLGLSRNPELRNFVCEFIKKNVHLYQNLHFI